MRDSAQLVKNYFKDGSNDDLNDVVSQSTATRALGMGGFKGEQTTLNNYNNTGAIEILSYNTSKDGEFHMRKNSSGLPRGDTLGSKFDNKFEKPKKAPRPQTSYGKPSQPTFQQMKPYFVRFQNQAASGFRNSQVMGKSSIGHRQSESRNSKQLANSKHYDSQINIASQSDFQS